MSSENVQQTVHNSSSSNWLDLLTGDVTHSDLNTQPVIEKLDNESNDVLSFLDNPMNEHYDGKDGSQFPSPLASHNGAKHYIDCLKSLSGSQKIQKLNFMEAMKLEIERLRLNLSPAERDRALLAAGTDPASINPNLLLDDPSIVRLCRIANSLAMVGQAALEDKITSSLGLDAKDIDAVDFWNVSDHGESCSGGMCEVHAGSDYSVQSSAESTKALFLCSNCKRKVCKVCCVGKGALLLASYARKGSMSSNGGSGRGGSSHGGQVDDNLVTLDGVMCKQCCSGVVLNALVLDYVRALLSSRRSSRVDTAAFMALDHVLGFPFDDVTADRCRRSGSLESGQSLGKLINREESLAEFPFACFLHSVETDLGAAPTLSLLTPLDSGPQNSYWRAPSNCNSVELAIVLGSISDVSGVTLVVSPCGYTEADTPTVQIWASNKINKEERSCMGKWEVQSLLESSPEFYGPEKSDVTKLPRHLKFSFKNPARCRIIWITLRLQRAVSASMNFGNDFNLLSLDENPFTEQSRRASFGSIDNKDPRVHAKRFIVFGTPLRTDAELTTPDVSEQVKLRNWLDTPPQLNRFKVPIDTERLIDNDLVLEQYLLPASPMVAGFRLDAFSAIRPRVTHSPTSDVNAWDPSCLLLEDRHITPAVLYIQVSALQETHKTATVAQYRIPETKPGTAMYFEFPGKIQSRRITFRLLGDIAAFADDTSEQDDSEYRSSPLASGLSLANRVKLFYYADSYELGKWASLSAI